MKKLFIFITMVVLTLSCYSQSKPKVKAIYAKKTSVNLRDGLRKLNGYVTLIYNDDTSQFEYWNGNSWIQFSSGGGGANQQLSINNNIVSLTNGGQVDLSGYLDDTDNQTITTFSLAGTVLTLTLENGNTKTVDLASISGGGGGAVASVAGKTGAVVLVEADITNLSHTVDTKNVLSDAITSTASTVSASSKAVKTVNDKVNTNATSIATINTSIGNIDGSETKVTAGTNVTVTGSGTVATPYVINSSGGGGASNTATAPITLTGSAIGFDDTNFAKTNVSETFTENLSVNKIFTSTQTARFVYNKVSFYAGAQGAALSMKNSTSVQTVALNTGGRSFLKNPLSLGGTTGVQMLDVIGNGKFTGVVEIADGIAANHAINKSQLSAGIASLSPLTIARTNQDNNFTTNNTFTGSVIVPTSTNATHAANIGSVLSLTTHRPEVELISTSGLTPFPTITGLHSGIFNKTYVLTGNLEFPVNIQGFNTVEIGSVITFIQGGAGKIRIETGNGLVVNTAKSMLSRAQHSVIHVTKVANKLFYLYGDLEVANGGGGVGGVIPSTPNNLASSNITNTGVTLTWDASTNADDYKVYRDGAHVKTVTAPTTTTNITGLNANTNYVFKVSGHNTTSNNESYSSNLTVHTTGGAAGLANPSSLTGQYASGKIAFQKTAYPAFDVLKLSLHGTDATPISVSDNGTYWEVTLSESFKWWNNVTYRYDSNNILTGVVSYSPVLPQSNTAPELWVDNTYAGTSTGSQAQPYKQIGDALNAAYVLKEGSIFVKATGVDYQPVNGNSSMASELVSQSPTESNPIYLIGYKQSDVGVNPLEYVQNYYNYGNTVTNIAGGGKEVIGANFDNTKFPTISQATADFGNVFKFGEFRQHIIMINFNIEKGLAGIALQEGNQKILFKNINIKNQGTENDNYGIGMSLAAYADKRVSYIRVKDCNIIDSAEANVYLKGDYCSIVDTKSYSRRRSGTIGLETDYNFLIAGGKFNSIKRSEAWGMSSIRAHVTHSFGIKDEGANSNGSAAIANANAPIYNIIYNCKSTNTGWNYELRNDRTAYNLISHSEVDMNVTWRLSQGNANISTVYSGSHNNKVQYMTATDVNSLFHFVENAEDESTGTLISDSNVFQDITATLAANGSAFRIYNIATNLPVGNSFMKNDVFRRLNITGNATASMFDFFYGDNTKTITMQNELIVDSTILNVPTKDKQLATSGWTFTNNTLTNSFTP